MLRFIVLLLLVSGSLSAQRTLSGIVTDAINGTPLSFINVFLKSDQQYGVLTNMRGEYRITLNEEQMKDRLVFSLLSFQTHEEPLWRLDTAATTLNLQMPSAFLELTEIVVISDLGLRNIVRRAMARVPENYGTDNYLLEAYSRAYSIDDGAYSQFIDAIVTLKDKPWNEPKRAAKARAKQFRLSDYTGDGREDLRIREWSDRALKQGYNGDFRNPIRWHKIHWLVDTDSLHHVRFHNRGEYLDGKDTLIKIQYIVDPRKVFNITEATARKLESYFGGELLINKSDYAVLRNTQGDLSKRHYSDAVYQKTGSKYYLKRIVSNSTISYDQETRTRETFRILDVNRVITAPKEIKQAWTGKPLNAGKVHEVKTPYDPFFWANHEIMIEIPAPEELFLQMEKLRSLDAQFRSNARRVRRDSTK